MLISMLAWTASGYVSCEEHAVTFCVECLLFQPYLISCAVYHTNNTDSGATKFASHAFRGTFVKYIVDGKAG